ncbi:MAG: AsmA family protein [Hyphomicrobiaceae bacterium]
MNRVLLIVGGVLVGLLAALFTVPVFIDWNRYRGTFEEEATRLLGRDVRVAGRVNLRLLPTPYIRFEKVRIADTQGGVGEPLFKADDFTIWLAVGSLFSGALEANEIELKRPILTLVLDEQGSGNWSDLGAAKSTSSFMPSSVALNAVRITNGTVTVLAPGAVERTRIEHINGELTAGSLYGPFKLAAAFSSSGLMRDVRLSTAAPEADGSVRFKGTVRSIDSGASYSLDGRARDILAQLKLEGELTAKLPLPRQVGPADQPAVPLPAGDSGLVDVRSAFKADTEAIELTDIALSFEQEGRPQLAAGSARMAWRQRTDLDLKLSSKWLDLDRIGGATGQSRPLAVLAGLARNLGGGLPPDGRTTVRFDLDQATLGGEVVSGLSATIERSADNTLQLKSFVAALPGNSRIEASGVIAPANPEALFDGGVILRGASLARLMSWGARGLDIGTVGQDGSFVLSGRLRLGETTFDGRSLTLQLGRHRLTGEAGWTGGTNRKLNLALDGTELDLSPLIDAEARPLATLRSVVDRLTTPTSGATATAPMDVQARVRFDRLVLGKTILTDVLADLTYVNGNLGLTQLRVGHPDEWQIDLRGDIAGLLRPGARGNVSGKLIAQTPERLDEMLALLEVPPELRPVARRAVHLAPLRLAARLAVGEKGAESYDLQLDGRAGQTRIAGTLIMAHKPSGWRDSITDLAITLDGGETQRLLQQLAPEALQPDPSPMSPGLAAKSARVMVRAVGTPKAGLATIATFDGADMAAELRGRLAVTDTAALDLAGDLRLTTPDLGLSLAGLGFRARPSLAKVAISGQIAVTGGSLNRWSFAARELDVANQRFAGKLDLDTAGPVTKVTGQIAVPRASLPYALALLSMADTSEVRRSASTAAPAPRRPTWPPGIFDLSPLARLDMAVTVEAGEFEIAPAIALGKARIEITSRDGVLSAKLPAAATLAGTLTAGLTLTRGPSAHRLTATANLAAARLEALGAAKAARATGRIDMKLDLEASGLGPQSLIAALKGNGEIRLAEARLAGLAPTAPRTVAEAIAAVKGELATDEVRRQLDAALNVGELLLGQRTLALEIADGIARVAPITLVTADARVTTNTVVDLGTLRVDSEWRLDPVPLSSERQLLRPPLPGITLVYTGPLAQTDALDRRLMLDGFERELIVRKYERDVEELERVRRDDEERVRREAERRRLEEMERQWRPVEPDATAPLPEPTKPDPQRQTLAEPPQRAAIEQPLPSAPRLPPLALMPVRPEVRQKLVEPEPLAPMPEPTAVPGTTTGSIPASADNMPRTDTQREPPRRTTAPAPVPRPKRDFFRDLGRDSP